MKKQILAPLSLIFFLVFTHQSKSSAFVCSAILKIQPPIPHEQVYSNRAAGANNAFQKDVRSLSEHNLAPKVKRWLQDDKTKKYTFIATNPGQSHVAYWDRAKLYIKDLTKIWPNRVRLQAIDYSENLFFSPSMLFLTNKAESKLDVFSLAGRPLFSIPTTEGLITLSVSLNEQQLSLTYSDRVEIWDLETKTLSASLSISAEGSRFLSSAVNADASQIFVSLKTDSKSRGSRVQALDLKSKALPVLWQANYPESEIRRFYEDWETGPQGYRVLLESIGQNSRDNRLFIATPFME